MANVKIETSYEFETIVNPLLGVRSSAMATGVRVKLTNLSAAPQRVTQIEIVRLGFLSKTIIYRSPEFDEILPGHYKEYTYSASMLIGHSNKNYKFRIAVKVGDETLTTQTMDTAIFKKQY